MHKAWCMFKKTNLANTVEKGPPKWAALQCPPVHAIGCWGYGRLCCLRRRRARRVMALL